MPLVETVTVDGAKIFRLARQNRKSVAVVARDIGRHPGSILNLRTRPIASVKFATQIAEALGVEVSEITLTGEEQEPRKPNGVAA
jgi:hypothetical protein